MQNKLPRYTIKIGGESGQGINSMGELVAQALKESGYYTFGYREYPSLIKGGYASHQTDFSDQPVTAPSEKCDILVILSRVALHQYLSSLRPSGIVIHSVPAMQFSPEEEAFMQQHNIREIYIPAGKVATQAGGMWLMANTAVVGLVWKLLDLELGPVKIVLKRIFAKKPDVIEPNIAVLQAGYDWQFPQIETPTLEFNRVLSLEREAIITGNQAIGLGAVAAGVRAYYAYPMTPSSSILSYLASIYHKTGMLVKQIEDEISVAQMTIGSMFMGTRALCGTSGGGFDLMTESVSLAAMTETPFVCVLAQRPGPATGLPTWTGAGDLNLAVYAGHGEFTRLVLAASDPASCYQLTQIAFNYAEKYQIPVILLTEKQIAESLFQIKEFPADPKIERHLVKNEELDSVNSGDRFAITPDGLNKRWLPGQSDATYNANSDEHLPDGSLTEEAQPAQDMIWKRIKKVESLVKELPEPVLYGSKSADIIFVGWGSVKNTVLDVQKFWNQHHSEQVAYVHYEYLYPLKTEVVQELANAGKKLVLIENNATGQFGNLFTATCGYFFKEKFLKYDGRPFFVEDVQSFLEKEFGKDVS